jgi:CubicO group peptidase (beta-lactamase class C family)
MKTQFLRTFLLTALALLAMLTPWQLRRAAAAANEPHTDLDIFSIRADRQLIGKTGSRNWAASMDGTLVGFNIVRSFPKNGEMFLLALNGNRGLARIYRVQENGQFGELVSQISQPTPALRCTSADVLYHLGYPRLVTHDAFSGRVSYFSISVANLAISLPPMQTEVLPAMRDKNLFNVYPVIEANGLPNFHFIGADTWTGDTATFTSNFNKVAVEQPQWTRGWTSMDHLRVGNTTYRLLYKAAGDPYKKAGESGDEARRLRIDSINVKGEVTTIDDRILPLSLHDYSSVRFVQFPVNRGYSTQGIFFYKRLTGDFALYAFKLQTGLGELLDSGKLKDGASQDTSTAPAPPYIDVEPMQVNGQTFLAGVSPDNAKPLSYELAENVGHAMHEDLKNTIVGYQFALAQSGRTYFSRAYGKRLLTNHPSDDEPMTARTQLNVGSVSKVITAVTMLRLQEKGKFNLNDKVGDHLAPGLAPANSWVHNTPIRNLLAHTTGIDKENPNKCERVPAALTMDCTDFFKAMPDLSPACGVDENGDYNCVRSYNNDNTIAARKIIERKTGAQSSIDIVSETRELWAEVAGLNQMTCQINPEAYNYGPCAGAANCYEYGGQSWRRYHPVSQFTNPEVAWSSSCSSGGWYASSRELLEFLNAIRYRRMLNANSTALLLDTGMKTITGSRTALGWDPAWEADGQWNLSKGGYAPSNGTAAKALITRMPNECDAVLQFNSETDSEFSGTNLLKAAFKSIVLGE